MPDAATLLARVVHRMRSENAAELGKGSRKTDKDKRKENALRGKLNDYGIGAKCLVTFHAPKMTHTHWDTHTSLWAELIWRR